MHPPTATDLTIQELLHRAETELHGIEKIVAERAVALKQTIVQRDLLGVLKALEQARFSVSYGTPVDQSFLTHGSMLGCRPTRPTSGARVDEGDPPRRSRRV